MSSFTTILLLFTAALQLTAGQEIGCFIPGECDGGNTVGFDADSGPEECLAFCQGVNNCNYFTHYSDPGSCVAFSTCPFVNTDCTDCISGDSTCEPTGELTCNVVGQCNGQFLGVDSTNNQDACDALCQADIDCDWWTFDTSNGFCTIFGDCADFDSSCSTCITGEPGCSGSGTNYQCNEPGTCQGSFVAVDTQPSKDDCIIYCKGDADCEYWTYDMNTLFCTLFRTCPTLDTSCTSCVSGEVGCSSGGTTSPPPTGNANIVFTVGGQASTKTSVADVNALDLSGEQRQCDTPRLFPYSIEQAIGFLTSEGHPVVCGGYSYNSAFSYVYSVCYEYSPSQDSWIDSPLTLGEAEFAMAGDYIDSSHFLTTGGRDLSSGYFDNSEEIDISTGILSSGSDIPTTLASHCVVKISDSEMVMIGGYDGSSGSDISYRYNIAAKTWSTMSNRMSIKRYGHACGYLKNENKIVVAGNASPESVFTEILDLSTDTWSDGPDFPYAAHGMGVAYPDSLDGNFVFVGGVSTADGGTFDQVVEYDPDLNEFKARSERLGLAAGLSIVLTVGGNVVNCS